MLTGKDVMPYRSSEMRARVLPQDRHDIGEAVLTLALRMARPMQAAVEEVKMLARYVIPHPHALCRIAV